ncbi:MAG: hypothetical protein COT73_01430 [Bdellovibrio sp. CG10_big_fil_rev_8_21_14_0_10_47_8]|nr:MAG: hypothetical protein COT73_01430 [Bdellovibrio sp. CG10_big_fil_rev_8_21_14_0_10_47_8]
MGRCLKIFGLVMLLLVLTSRYALAQRADDQRILTPERQVIVNPVPTPRDFVKINQQHQILVAEVDSGVDYNHPLLQQNIHFRLDANGKPIGLGWDFTANDAWPAPLVGASVDLNPKAPEDVKSKQNMMIKTLSAFLSMYPLMTQYFNPYRQADNELSGGLFHGTHVAGLMVYDEPRLGLMAYRALPFNIQYENGKEVNAAGDDGISDAIQKAIDDGARVINMSLGLTLTKNIQLGNPAVYEFELGEIKRIQKMAQAHPEVAFVAATGNDGAWIDDRSRMNLPCGVEAKNILCVGALDKEGGLAYFSNVVLPDYPFLVAPGESIVSLFPTQFCNINGFFMGGFTMDGIQSDSARQASFFRGISKICTDKTNGFYSSSGTSMATPITARMVAKVLLDNPSLSGSEAIQKVLGDAADLKVGRMLIKKLMVEKPSWYPAEQDMTIPTEMLLSEGDGAAQVSKPLVTEKKYFEFYSK